MKLRTVTGYNDQKNTMQVKKGGTCVMVFDEFANMVEIMDVEKHSLGAGFR